MYFVLFISVTYLLIPNLKYKGLVGVFLLIIFPIICVIMFSGGFGLETVETRLWGGLFLTLVILSTILFINLSRREDNFSSSFFKVSIINSLPLINSV